jgi:O-antigen ligase
MRTPGGRKTDNADLLGHGVLLLMLIWLISIAGSATSLICLILGVSILLFMRLPLARRQVRYLGTYSIVLALLTLFLYSVPGILEAFVGILGRSTTLTGRTDLWSELLREPINSLLGVGYQSFWLGHRAERYWETFTFHPNQAHNGYLETYLNGGLVGVCLLIAVIVSTGSDLKKQLLLGDSYGILRFSFFVVSVVYNWTEAMFNRLSLIWIMLIIAALNYSRSPRSMAEHDARLQRLK